MSFTTNKIFVFKSPGNWIREYLKCYIIYGLSAIFGIFILWIFVDYFHININISQAFVLITSVIISSVGHSKFTYKKK